MLQKKEKQREKKLSPKEILDDAFDFATKYPNDPMAVSASLMVVAKTIYILRFSNIFVSFSSWFLADCTLACMAPDCHATA